MVYVIRVCWRLASSQAVSKPVWHVPLLCVQWETPDDGQRNCPNHVEFYSKNKFEKLVHLVGFIIRIYHDARSPELQIRLDVSVTVRSNSPSSLRCRGVYLTTPHLWAHIKEQRLCSVSIAISLNALLFIMLKPNQNRRYFFFVSELWKEYRLDISQMKVVSACVIVEGIRKWNFVVMWMKMWMCYAPLVLLKRQITLRESAGKATANLVMCVCPSICPLVWTDSHAVGFRKNLVFGICCKLCPPIAILVGVGENSLYITSYVHLSDCSL